MKTQFAAVALALTTFLVTPCLTAAPTGKPGSLTSASTAQLVEAAVPALAFTAGERTWSGGWTSSGFVEGHELGANTAYAVFSHKEGHTDRLSARAIAEDIRDHLVATYKLPVSAPSSTWTAETPEGFAPDEFAKVFVVAHRGNKQHAGGTCLTVQVALLPQGEFAVTLSFMALQ